MVEHVGHLAVESCADSLRDLCGFGNAKVHIPAVKAAVESPAGAAIDRWIGRREERESAVGIVVDGIRIGKRRQGSAGVVNRTNHYLIVQREICAAVSKHRSLAELLATGAVEDIKRKARRESPHAGNVPSADDLVHRAAAGSVALPATKRQIIGDQRRESVAPVEGGRTIIPVEIKGIGGLVQALLVLANLVERMRVGVVERKIQARRGRLVQTNESGVVIWTAITDYNVG